MRTFIIIIVILAISFLILKKKNVSVEAPEYNPDEASIVTYSSLPKDVSSLISKEDVDIILDLEFEFQKKIGLVNNPTGDGQTVAYDEAANFIKQESEKKGKNYSNDIINEVLKAEEVYLKQIGVME